MFAGSRRRRGIGATLVALLLATLAGCDSSNGGGQPPPPPPPPPPPASPGLDMRPANPDCVAPQRPLSNAAVTLVRVYPNLVFSAPISMRKAPNDAGRWYLIERGGVLRRFEDVDQVAATEQVLDISSRIAGLGAEGGLLGFTFHPDFANNGEVFLSYTTGMNPLRSIISRFISADGGRTLDPNSEQVLMTVNQPQGNHNGGNILFGADGYLYIGLGDGGGAHDPHGNGQNTLTVLGAMLRIDVDGGAPYAIPPDNPFAGNPLCNVDGTGTADCPEIYAYGFRNPWRWSFDAPTGALWLGDVGQNEREEIDLIERGGNYGWPIREGTLCNQAAGCPPAGLIDPVAEYPHTEGRSVTGGYVYRGTAIAELAGVYVFGDFSTGRLWGLYPGDSGAYERRLIGDAQNGAFASFAQDELGEIYGLDIAGGTIHQLQDAGGGGGAAIAQDLAATGCVDAADPTQPAAGLVPYGINAAFWSDGAAKQRWVGLPDGTFVTQEAGGDLTFPPGTVLMKNFSVAGRLIETRLFMRHPDGVWAGYSYEWNDAETQATLVSGGRRRDLGGGQEWIYPSGSDCQLCHTAAAGRSLGLEIGQLNDDFTYPSTGRTDNQLNTWDAIGLFSAALPDVPANLAALADPQDAQASLEDRVRAYLHANCAGCHRSGGPTPVAIDLRFDVALSATGTCNAMPQAGSLGIAGARIVAPGAAARSVLIERMNRRDAAGMPPVASHLVDAAGVTLLRDWVNSLAGCP